MLILLVFISVGLLLYKIIDYFHPNINIIAEVKSENKSSVSLFLKAGYRKIKTGKFVRTKINQSG